MKFPPWWGSGYFLELHIMNYCLSGGGNPFGARSPFGQNIDPEDILKSFFGERGSPFGFGTSSGGFEDFNQVQQVRTMNWGS